MYKWMIVYQFEHVVAWFRARGYRRAIRQGIKLAAAQKTRDETAQGLARLSAQGERRARAVAQQLQTTRRRPLLLPELPSASAERERVEQLLAPWRRFFDDSGL
jgi:hypothetical protein